MINKYHCKTINYHVLLIPTGAGFFVQQSRIFFLGGSVVCDFVIADHFLMLRILSSRHHPIQNVNSLMTCFLSSIVGSLFGQGANSFFQV